MDVESAEFNSQDKQLLPVDDSDEKQDQASVIAARKTKPIKKASKGKPK